MINIKKRILLLIIFILLSYSVFGVLEISLKKDSYGPNQALSGGFNFSFGGELDADATVIVSLNGIIFEESLKNFLGVSGTAPSYSKSEKPVSTATIIFKEAGSNTSYGVDLTQNGDIVPAEINKFMFNVSGDVYEETTPMLPSIRLGDMDVWNYRGNITMPESYINPGAPYLYSPSRTGIVGVKPQQAFCEKTRVKAAPKYKVIAEVKKVKDGYSLMAFIIDDIEEESIPNSCGADSLCCSITNVDSELARRSCIINKGINFDSEKYLCLKLVGTGSIDTYYNIGKEVRSDKVAGYFIDDMGDVYPQTNTDYFIWYEYAKFETNLSGKANLSDFTSLVGDDYPSKGNIIPITVKTKGKGKIQLVDLFTDIKSKDGPSSEYYRFTPITYKASKVSYQGIKKHDLSSGFLVDLVTPMDEGTYTLTISIGGETKSKTISVVSQPYAWIMWEPEFPGVNQEVMFNGSESFSPEGLRIVSYKWDFGDGKFGNGSVVRHSYNKTGDYNVVLTVIDENSISGVYDAIINIRSILGDLGVALNATELTIDSMKNYIANADEHVKNSAELLGINKALENSSTELSLLKIRYNGSLSLAEAARETELNKISNDLYSLMNSVPKVFSVQSYNITSKLVSIGDVPAASELGVQVSDEDSFKLGLIGYQEDINIKGEARLVYIVYISDNEESFILVKKTIKTTKSLKGKLYEISSGVKKVITDGYEAVVPNSVYRWPAEKREIVYMIEGEDVNIAAKSKTFVLPPLSEIGEVGGEILEYEFDCGNNVCDSSEDRISCPEDCKGKYPITFIIFLVILTIIGIYYINFYHGKFGLKRLKDIKRFGKKEKLFKSEKDIINLTNYIKSSLNKGLDKNQIVYTLKQRGWSGEQIEEGFKRAKR